MSPKYTEEFKIEAVKQITERGHSFSTVAKRLDVTTNSLRAWIEKYGSGPKHAAKVDNQQMKFDVSRLSLNV